MTLCDPCLIVEAADSTISYISCTSEQHIYAYNMHCAWNTQKQDSSKKLVFSFKEICLRQLQRQYCVVVHKIPNQVIMSCWRKSYYNHAEQVSSPSLGEVQDIPMLKIFSGLVLLVVFRWSLDCKIIMIFVDIT